MPDDPEPGFFDSFSAPLIMGDFADYAKEIGHVTWSWSALHGELGDLLSSIITGVGEPKVPRAIWQSIKSETAARDMLRAAAGAHFPEKDPILEEVDWLIKEVGKVSVYRNDAAHIMWTAAPLPDLGWVEEMRTRRAAPDHRSARKGAQLEGKDAGKVFRALANHSVELTFFVKRLIRHVQGLEQGQPLPDRPSRPRLLHEIHQLRAQQSSPHKAHPKNARQKRPR